MSGSVRGGARNEEKLERRPRTFFSSPAANFLFPDQFEVATLMMCRRFSRRALSNFSSLKKQTKKTLTQKISVFAGTTYGHVASPIC